MMFIASIFVASIAVASAHARAQPEISVGFSNATNVSNSTLLLNRGNNTSSTVKAMLRSAGRKAMREDPENFKATLKQVEAQQEADQRLPTDYMYEAAGRLVGLVPAPSREEIKFLKTQATHMENYKERLEAVANGTRLPDCEESKRKYPEAFKLAKAKGDARIAKKALKIAKAREKVETKREQELPNLVSAAKDKAMKERRLRKEAEAKLTAALLGYAQLHEDMDRHLQTAKEAVQQQKFEDRLRAYEDARMAAEALKEADKERQKLRLRPAQQR